MTYLKSIATAAIFLSNLVFASDFAIDRRIHDEYESTGGYSMGLGQGGMAAVSDVSSVRLNPAMLALDKKYSVFGSFHWPTFGREFYQAGVVDSKTSNFAAGLTYTGFNDDFDLIEYDRVKGKESTLQKRLGVALAQVIGKVSAGFSVFFAEGFRVNESTISAPESKKVTTFGLGLAGFISPTIRFGLSAENLGNKKLPEIAPQFLRAGLAYLMGGGNTSIHLDYINRQRIKGVEYDVVSDQQVFNNGFAAVSNETADEKEFAENEQMVVGSVSLRVYDLVRILASYGADLVTDRTTMSGGIAIVNDQYSLSYSSSRPYLSSESSHQAINLGMQISM